MHDPRIGRFFAIDPLSDKYPHNSPYAFSENDVIACVELEGLEKLNANGQPDYSAYGKKLITPSDNSGTVGGGASVTIANGLNNSKPATIAPASTMPAKPVSDNLAKAPYVPPAPTPTIIPYGEPVPGVGDKVMPVGDWGDSWNEFAYGEHRSKVIYYENFDGSVSGKRLDVRYNGEAFEKPNIQRCIINDYGALSGPIGLETGLVRSMSAAKSSSNLWRVGAYSEIRSLEFGLDAHHVGQKALMRNFVSGYNLKTAPAILVPALGHTQKGLFGIVSRNTSGFTNARQVIARDIIELRRVYGSQLIPNSALQELIQMNKTMYPSAFKKM